MKGLKLPESLSDQIQHYKNNAVFDLNGILDRQMEMRSSGGRRQRGEAFVFTSDSENIENIEIGDTCCIRGKMYVVESKDIDGFGVGKITFEREPI